MSGKIEMQILQKVGFGVLTKKRKIIVKLTPSKKKVIHVQRLRSYPIQCQNFTISGV